MVRYQNHDSVIAIVTGECSVLVLQTYGIKVCAVLFGFWSSFLIIYSNLRCINTHRWTTTPIFLWSPLSEVSLLCWYYKNTVLKVCVILLDFYSTHYKYWIWLFSLFLVTTLLLIFKNKEGLVRLLQQFILCCYFFETVRLKNYVNILSNIFVVTVCIAYSLSLLVYHYFCRSCCC